MTEPVTAPTAPRAAGVLLVVEDDPDHAFLVRRRLRERLAGELEVLHLGTVAETVARLGAGDVRCVVLDLSLPDAKGLEAVLAVRSAAADVPVVVLTGTDSDELGRQALELGAQDYLVKGTHGPDAVGRAVVFALERTKRHAAEQQRVTLASRLQLVLEASAEGICTVDADGVLVFANRAAAELLGAGHEPLLGRRLHDLHHCPTSPCRLDADLRSAPQTDAGEQVFRALDGRLRVLEVRARELHDDAVRGGIVVNLTDVTSRRRAQEALADAQALAHLGSWEWDPVGDQVVWSDEMYRVTGLSREDVPPDGRALAAYVALADLPDRGEVQRLFEGWDAPRPPALVTHRLVRPDGSLRWVQCRASAGEVTDASDGSRTRRVLGTVQDITDQKAAEDALAHQALHDALTGLPNRALLLDRLERALADTRRDAVAVVFMDLDRFKWVNDSLDHAAGDQLLVAVAARLTRVLRPSDTLARLGGDEFVLVCEHLTAERQLFDIVDRISRELDAPFVVEGRELVVTTSMGVAVAAPGEDVAPESLIRDADTAMYRAKENGRARCEIFDEAMRQRASERLEVQNDLRRGLVRGEVEAWYQPVVDLGTGRVTGCEALARWRHPDKGLVLPESFIPHAEETGAIVGLGDALLLQACRQVAAWNARRPAADPLTVSVNVSARQLSSAQLVQTVRTALETSGLAPHHLCLEVTESVVMEDVAISGAVLGRLRDLGVRTAVDDFGTGYSSLAYLLSLPVDVLKVDRSFVQVLDVVDGPAGAIVRAIAALADALGLGVLAEGVETPEQLAHLTTLGVQQGQGFLWGRAVPAELATWAHASWVPSSRASIDLRPSALGHWS